MRADFRFISGVGIGAGLMLLFDPSYGARRRGRVRDWFVHEMRRTADATGTGARDLSHRVQGLAAKSLRTVRNEPVSDDVLVSRVRSKLGRFSSHPRAIDARAEGGVVILEGPILAREHGPLVRAVGAVPGLSDVVDRLRVHETAGSVPGLQGGRPRGGESSEFRPRRWTPAERFLAGATGGGLVAYGAARRGAIGAVAALAGMSVVARSLTDLDAARLTGIGAGRRAVDVQKTIDILAPVDEVFDIWCDLEHFPEYTSHVQEVRHTRVPGQTHWKVTGPLGPIEFDAVITELIRNEVIAWRTVIGSPVQHGGIVRFDPIDEGLARVTIRMSYNPPGGALGDAGAKLAGLDLKSQLDDDLMRMKTYIESGRQPHDAARL
jgi:uncharacterized membrane protein